MDIDGNRCAIDIDMLMDTDEYRYAHGYTYIDGYT